MDSWVVLMGIVALGMLIFSWIAILVTNNKAHNESKAERIASSPILFRIMKTPQGVHYIEFRHLADKSGNWEVVAGVKDQTLSAVEAVYRRLKRDDALRFKPDEIVHSDEISGYQEMDYRGGLSLFEEAGRQVTDKRE